MSIRLQDLPFKTGHLFIGGALLLALLSAFLIQNVAVKQGKKQAPVEVQTQPVVVAAATISAGKPIEYQNLRIMDWPLKFPPGGSVFSDPRLLVGRIAKYDIVAGEPVYRQKLAGEKSNGGLPVIIPNGMRAVTISVSEIKGVAGFIKPGDRVDVLTSLDEGNDSKVTKTVLQNVLVLATAQKTVDDTLKAIKPPSALNICDEEEDPDSPACQMEKKNGKNQKKDDAAKKKKKKRRAKNSADDTDTGPRIVSSITLAVNPEEAETLVMAEEAGSLRLSLRPEDDLQVKALAGASNRGLGGSGTGGSTPPASPPPDSGIISSQLPPPMPPMGANGHIDAPHGEAPLPPFSAGEQVELIQGSEKSNVSF
jgi:pilus assembly protein CpaB